MGDSCRSAKWLCLSRKDVLIMHYHFISKCCNQNSIIDHKFVCLSSFQEDFGRIYAGPYEIPAGPQNNIASPKNIMTFLIDGVKILF